MKILVSGVNIRDLELWASGSDVKHVNTLIEHQYLTNSPLIPHILGAGLQTSHEGGVCPTIPKRVYTITGRHRRPNVLYFFLIYSLV